MIIGELLDNMTLDGFSRFKEDFLNWAHNKLVEWSVKYKIKPPSLILTTNKEVYTALYVFPKVTVIGITGPAIVFREKYLFNLYNGATKRNMIETLWNYLSWVLAHEFGHHLTCERKPEPLRRVVEGTEFSTFRNLVNRMEISASLTAFHLTHKTNLEKRYEFWKITGIPYSEYITECIHEYWSVSF